VSPLSVRLILEQCPSLTELNIYALPNLNGRVLMDLLQVATAGSHPSNGINSHPHPSSIPSRIPLSKLDVGGCAHLHPQELEALCKRFPQVQF